MSNCITTIEADLKDPNIRHIYADEICVASVSVSDLKRLGFELGQVWSLKEEESLKQLQRDENARSIALQLLSRRAWSKKELKNRLIKRGCESNTAVVITDELEVDGWLDDLAYAGACIRQWLRVEPASRGWISHKLAEKGVSDSIASLAIEEELGEKSEQEAATELATIRIAKVSNLDETTQRRRVITALQRRGFSSDVASEAFRQAT